MANGRAHPCTEPRRQRAGGEWMGLSQAAENALAASGAYSANARPHCGRAPVWNGAARGSYGIPKRREPFSQVILEISPKLIPRSSASFSAVRAIWMESQRLPRFGSGAM